MNLSIPVYVEEHSSAGGIRRYRAHPLFDDSPSEEGDQLSRVLARLASSLRRSLERLSEDPRHDALARRAFHPVLEETQVKTWIDLGDRRVRLRLLAVSFRWLDRRIAYVPAAELWFAIERGRSLEDRAAAILGERLRRERKDEREAFDPARHDLGDKGRAWITTLEVDLRARQSYKARDQAGGLAALLGLSEELDGRNELERVGRSLEGLYPEGLARAVGVELPLAELERRLSDPRRRPVLLLGAQGSGKTALVHERVYRRMAGSERPPRHGNTWLVAPQRLISGMSYVGQWEARLLAIVREVRRRAHVLYVDDLLGLFRAGVSASADLSVAQVLKPVLERGEIPFLAEATPEEFRVLRERDRGFADLFEPVVLREPDEEANLRILLAVERRLEDGQRCRFGLEVLPAVLDLQRRFVRDVSFPGKGARMLEEMAARGREREVEREDALAAFQGSSGLSLEFLDPRRRLDPAQVVRDLSRRVVGQSAAVEAMADVVGIAKARLNDPRRPLGVLLLAGPTGVGKTQCAKSLAEVLFGSEERLLRFDLNEYAEPGSAARLVGTFHRPEGLLTGPVRRQPFAIVLLDEIEKAAPEVFDLLLQLMGEGRLTDAIGRTVDFANAVLLMTTNLGVREASGSAGFRESMGEEDAVAHYRREVERFFRPEFVNRIDRIVPFRSLDREDVKRIARVLIAGVFTREGLVRRKVVLDIDPEALDRVADLGFHPKLGARALKRAIERHLARPISRRLVGAAPEAPAIVGVLPLEAGFAVSVHVLEDVAPLGPQPAGDLEGHRSFLERIRREIAPSRPAGAVRQGAISEAELRYFRIRALFERHEERVEALGDRIEEAARPSIQGLRTPMPPRKEGAHAVRGRQYLKDMASAESARDYILELARAVPPPASEIDWRLAELAGEAAFLDLAARSGPGVEDRALLVCFADRPSEAWRLLAEAVAAAYAASFDLAVRSISPGAGDERLLASLVEGPGALALARLEEGTHLLADREGALSALRVQAIPIGPGEDPGRALEEHVASRARWIRTLRAARAGADQDPWRTGPVVRLYEATAATIDLRTGGAVPEFPPGEALARWIRDALPRPPELVSRP